MSQKFEEIVKQEIDELFVNLNMTDINRAKTLILESEDTGGRVHITGIGKSSYVAGYIASLLSSTGTPSYFLDGTEAVHGSSGQVNKGDVVVAISNSGETKELLNTVNTLKENGAVIIGVSKSKESSLSKMSDVSLCTITKNEGDYLNKPPRVSVIKQTLLLQELTLKLQEEKGLTARTYVKWHPGGSIGESLKSSI
ncbi:SIS domain-containing protein [Companilactobacillus sp. HBUAS59544]|uniref:SIS domain-containing protein n=1 Tax=Companilactobacillus sp. HBUAS59544 TaxID=3109363 RepID=UPI002FF18D32